MNTKRSPHIAWTVRTLLEAALFTEVVRAFRYLTQTAHRGPDSVTETLVREFERGDFVFAVASLALVALVLAPLLEEGVTRGLPLWLLRKFGGSGFWLYLGVGVVTSVVFALGHAPSSWLDGVPHFAFGIIAWNAEVKRGLRYGILLHFTVNLIAFVTTLFYIFQYRV